ncbi:DUF1998 domain-containing protein [Acinetobacter sp. YH12136]|uniref:DUF1998 domain-containing protein n=1 Tax=Acinetobacter sp. YH12136 TaxID=2601120 RepID=UPI0015D32BCB|nr:DUF1998 domain-containing protein [Acinetobacter sp. YH12136]
MKREVRASNLTAISSVGAMVDIAHESFLIPGIEQWIGDNDIPPKDRFTELKLDRLENAISRKMYKFSDQDATLLVSRFPRALFCEKCRSIVQWKSEYEKVDGYGRVKQPTCIHSECHGKMVPMRFVGACEDGHLTDINWRLWAHSGPNANRDCRATDQLKFIVNTKGAGLDNIAIQCVACKSSRTLKDLTNPQYTEKLLHCYANHPWIFSEQPTLCDKPLKVMQRGATNIYYPKVVSAFDIPCSIEQTQQNTDVVKIKLDNDKDFNRIKKLYASVGNANMKLPLEKMINQIAQRLNLDLSVITAYLDESNTVLSTESKQLENVEKIQLSLQEEEIETFKACLINGETRTDNFYAIRENLIEEKLPWMAQLFKPTLLLHKIREVRAFTGFQRVKLSESKAFVPADLGGPQNWLPVSEVFGEGILIQFNLQILTTWVRHLPVDQQEHFNKLEEKRQEQELYFLPVIEPIFLMIHTLCHLLIRQLAFESGYTSSSLREKIYYDPLHDFAGVLIYTTDSDSEGSLGGLVVQGERHSLSRIIMNALEKGQWCSADPVCGETFGQGLGGFNHAACHSCTLLPETSCAYINSELDRALIYSDYGILKYLGVTL